MQWGTQSHTHFQALGVTLLLERGIGEKVRMHLPDDLPVCVGGEWKRLFVCVGPIIKVYYDWGQLAWTCLVSFLVSLSIVFWNSSSGNRTGKPNTVLRKPLTLRPM
jgi:hypothetical protein